MYTVINPGTTNKDDIDFQGWLYQIAYLMPKEVPMPYSKQVSIGVSRQFTDDFALDIDYVAVESLN